jgi:hypothetical protein
MLKLRKNRAIKLLISEAVSCLLARQLPINRQDSGGGEFRPPEGLFKGMTASIIR